MIKVSRSPDAIAAYRAEMKKLLPKKNDHKAINQMTEDQVAEWMENFLNSLTREIQTLLIDMVGAFKELTPAIAAASRALAAMADVVNEAGSSE
jgi:hypothetical protein